ncbi:hypothetical protein AKO1_015136, partial [Acrasis kona]
MIQTFYNTPGNSQETIIMSLKREHDDYNVSREFYQTLDEYLNNFSLTSRFYIGDDIPKLKDVRGKVVIMRRFKQAPNSNHGLNCHVFEDNVNYSFDINKCRVQDYYHTDPNTKKNAIDALMTKAVTQPNDNLLWINFFSGINVGMGLYAEWFSQRINPWALERLPELSLVNKQIWKGVLAFDYINHDLVQLALIFNQRLIW